MLLDERPLSRMTPDGFPLAYEVMPGNTADKTTLLEFGARSDPHNCPQLTHWT